MNLINETFKAIAKTNEKTNRRLSNFMNAAYPKLLSQVKSRHNINLANDLIPDLEEYKKHFSPKKKKKAATIEAGFGDAVENVDSGDGEESDVESVDSETDLI